MLITIYGLPKCSQCKVVTNYLTDYNIHFEYKEVGKDITPTDLNTLAHRTVRSVPFIMVDGSEAIFGELKALIDIHNHLDTLHSL